MYHRQNITNNNDNKPYQMIDLSTLRNKLLDNNIYTFMDNNKLTVDINKEGVSVVSILGLFYFAASPTINQQIFAGINLQLSPKTFQSFAHQKTMKFLLQNLLIKQQQLTQQSLTQLINEYPIANFIIEAYCRAICIKQAKKGLEESQRETLENFGLDIRGNLLDMLVNCLQMNLTLVCGPFIQTYGLEKNSRKVQIKFAETKIEAEIINKRLNFLYSRTIQNSGIKTIKQINTMEIDGNQSLKNSSVEPSFIAKDPLAATTEFTKCERCKMIKSRCYCSRRQIGSPYHTPNNASRFEKNAINNAISAQIPMPGLGKCTCHKVFCICRK